MDSAKTHGYPRGGEWALLGAALLVAFGLRAWAIKWGLPFVDHPDEPAIVNPVLAMVRRGDWRPHFFNYPSLYPYGLRALFALHWRLGVGSGLYTTFDRLPETTDIYTVAPGFFVWGRALTIACAVATVALLARIGRRWWDPTAGLVAAALLAILPFHVRHSQFITTDVASALTGALALRAALRLIDGDAAAVAWRRYAVAGLCVGLAAGTKYNVALVAGAVATAHCLAWGRRSLRQSGRLAWAAAWSAIGFLVTTPTILIDRADFARDMRRQLESYSGGHGDLVGRWPVGGYLEFLWGDGLRPLPFLAVLLGLALTLRRRHRPGIVLLGFAAPYLLLTLSQATHFMRNLLPLFPVFALWAAYAIAAGGAATQRIPARWWPRRIGARTATAGLAALVMALPLYQAAELSHFEALPNSKVLAGDYVRDVLPRGLPVAAELNPVQWAGNPAMLPLRSVAAHDRAWYAAQGVRYLVANAYQRVPDERAAYDRLVAGATLVRRFVGDDDGMPGPQIDIYDLGAPTATLALTPQPARFGPGLSLLGFQRGVGEPRPAITPLDGNAAIRGGQNLLLNLYWQVDGPLDKDYSLFLHVLDAQGAIVAQRDAPIRGGDYPSSRWKPGELVVDSADLPLPALPPGSYRIKIGVYDLATFARLPVSGTSNATEDQGLILMPLEIAP